MKIVVISPTYNEKTNMEKLVPLLENEIFPKIINHTMYLLVPDDNSPDGTGKVIKKYQEKWKNIVLLEGEKKGLGAAYIKAMRYASEKMKADAVIEFDADFQHDPYDIPRLVDAMDKGADYVIGSRYIPGGKIPAEWGLHRKIMSFFGSAFARIVLFMPHIHDMTSGYKLTKIKYLEQMDLENLYSKYYAYKIQMLYEVYRLGAKIKEVPIIFYERKEGSSKISKKDLFDSLWVVIRLRWRDSQRVVKFLMVGGTGFFVQVLSQELSIMIGFTHPIAVGIGAEMSIISNFLFNNFWTFTDTLKLKERSSLPVRFAKFNTASFGSIILQIISVALAEKLFGETITILSQTMPTRLLVLIPTIIFLVIPLNYLIYNKLIWKTQYLKK